MRHVPASVPGALVSDHGSRRPPYSPTFPRPTPQPPHGSRKLKFPAGAELAMRYLSAQLQFPEFGPCGEFRKGERAIRYSTPENVGWLLDAFYCGGLKPRSFGTR